MAVNARLNKGKNKRAAGSPVLSSPSVGHAAVMKAAVVDHQAGRLDKAKAVYQAILATEPGNADALQLLGVLSHQQGESEAGVALLEKAIAVNPANGAAHNNLGGVLRALGRHSDAERHFSEAVRLTPRDIGGRLNHAAVLYELSRLEEAASACQAALKIDPNCREALRKLIQIDIAKRDYKAAEEKLRALLVAPPDDADDSIRLALALYFQGKEKEARNAMARAVALPGGSVELRQNLETLLNADGRDEISRARYRDALGQHPTLWVSEANIAIHMIELGRNEVGRQIMEDILAARSDESAVWNDIAALLVNAGKYDDAKPYFQKAIELDQSSYAAYGNLGSAYLHQGHSEIAAKYYRLALKANPGYMSAQVCLIRALRNLRELDQAHLFARGALDMPALAVEDMPNLIQLFKAVCDFDSLDSIGDLWALCDKLNLNSLAALFLDMMVFARSREDVQRLTGLIGKWAAHIQAVADRAPLTEPHRANEDGKIHLGVLSSDLRSHSVARFLRPIIQRYDRSRFAVHCYSAFRATGDAVQEEIKGLVDSFMYVDSMSPREIAQAIRVDGVDVLLELNGFTTGTRINALAYKPAPVQMSWLGYPFTCGLKAIDYIVMDRFLLPDESTLVEEPIVMPDAWICVSTFNETEIDPVLPMERNGYVTFGTLNNPYKFDRDIIALWAKVMSRVPNSRFLLVRPEASSVVLCRNLVEEFAKQGVGADRIFLLDNWKEKRDHLSYYNEIDISLDTFPVTGGTTTCEALWMGVPVVSLVGEAYHHRVSSAILKHCGLAELCVETNDQFVDRAIRLAKDHAKLSAWRTGLRDVMRASPLCDEPRFVHQFQEMLEQVVRHHGLR